MRLKEQHLSSVKLFPGVQDVFVDFEMWNYIFRMLLQHPKNTPNRFLLTLSRGFILKHKK